MEPLVLTFIILGALILFVTRLIPFEVTSILIVVALALTGILEPSDALQGFSSTATITVAAMFVLGAGLSRTGAVDFLAQHVK